MRGSFINVGCGKRKIPGFINLDADRNGDADLRVDVTQGLPFLSNVLDGIFSEHFIEHLSQAEGVAFLRECRRVLAPNGILRIATPDLDYVVERYGGNWREQAWLKDFGYDWIANSCEMFNISMREWGHKWVYNKEELVRLASYVGFSFKQRCVFGQSDEPSMRGLEYREDSKLIVEFVKERPWDGEEPLVSILIAAYNPRYFRACLESALHQTYSNLEIVICDDSPTDEIRVIMLEYAHSDRRINYFKNERRLGGCENYVRCFSLATGEYIKFLNDDDMLHPTCIQRMARCLRQFPEVTLVTSYRQCISDKGVPLPDILPTQKPVMHDSLIDGTTLANAVLETCINFIGEPTTVMFRKRDLSDNRPHILSFADRPITYNVDVAMWLTLLSKGDAVYLVDTLSYFRQHAEQVQAQPDACQQGQAAWKQLRLDGTRMGLLNSRGQQCLRVRRLDFEAVGREETVAHHLQTRDVSISRVLSIPQVVSVARRSPPAIYHSFEVSIVIPVFNRVELTDQCLSHLAQVTQGVSYEVIVVDNASTDETPAFLAMLSGDVQVIRNHENLGFAKACNQGAQAANGRYLAFLNNDTIPLEGWLRTAIEEVKAYPDVAIVGSKLLYPNDTIQHAGMVFNRANSLPYHLYRGFPSEAPVVNRRRELQAVTGACMLVRREMFEAVGGLDEEYRNGFEDVDLCLRVRDRGGRIIYQPSSTLYHLESQTPGRKDHEAENTRRFLERWGSHWLVDEDAVSVPEGYSINEVQENGHSSYRVRTLNDAEDKARWERVAEVERLGQSGNMEAVRSLLAQPDLWPHDSGVLRWAAQICDRAEVPGYAEAFWKRALDFGATSEALVALSHISLEKGALDEAERYLQGLMAQIPTHDEGWLLQGILALQRQHFVIAKAAFENALRDGSNARKARKGLGMAAMGLGQMETAWDMFATVLASEIDDAEAIHCLLRAGAALERWQPLTEYLSVYLKLNPADLSVRFALAGVQVRLGDLDGARETYEMICLLDPTFVGLDDLAQLLEKGTISKKILV